MREIGIADHGADTDTAIGKGLDAVEPRQSRDVDQTVRTADPALHQVEQIGAGRKVSRARFGCGCDGVGDRRRPDVIKSLHAERLWSDCARFFWASSTASVIPA